MRLNDKEVAAWTPVERANVNALRIRSRVRSRGGNPTSEESTALRAWSGWGMMPRLFAPDPPQSLLHVVGTLLGPGEPETGSTTASLNAHWTPSSIAAEIWKAVKRYVRETGWVINTVLEPSCGIGEFVVPAPAGTNITAVEVDPVTSDIARLLLPSARVLTESFAETDFAEMSFDVCVGNLPFSRAVLADQVHNRPGRQIPEHFLIKAARLVKPGGLLAVIVPSRVMDAPEANTREHLAGLTTLLGAVRFPSHTASDPPTPGVVADLLILRRKEGHSSEAQTAVDWTRALPQTGPEGSTTVNQYFLAHPAQVLGRLTSDDAGTRVVAEQGQAFARLPELLELAFRHGDI